MQERFLTRIGVAVTGVGAISTVIGLLTGITLGCTLAGCPPSIGTGFQGFGVSGLMLVYYRGCNACTISPWIVLGGLFLAVGLIIAIGGFRAQSSTQPY